VTVTLSPGCPYTSSYIDYRTEDLTAEAGKDYVHVSGRLLTGPWTFDIPILEDAIPEPDEVAKIIISGPSSGAPGSGGGSCVGDDQSKTGSLTILENDGFASPTERQSAPAQVAGREDGSGQPAGQSNVAAPSQSQRAAAGTTPVESGVQDSTEVSIAEGLSPSRRRRGPTKAASLRRDSRRCFSDGFCRGNLAGPSQEGSLITKAPALYAYAGRRNAAYCDVGQSRNPAFAPSLGAQVARSVGRNVCGQGRDDREWLRL
jgi:hypothetical protein